MLKDNVKERIKERISKLKLHKAKDYFISNIAYPSKEMEKDKYLVEQSVKEIEDIIPEIIKLSKELKKYFKNIWDQNEIVATYLLINKAIKSLIGAISEAKKGNVSNMMELCRSGEEATKLSHLFLTDNGKKFLDRWFNGEIIGNDESRKAMDKSINEMFEGVYKQQLSVEDVMKDIYWTYSLYTHSGYAGILDTIDVYHEDFDFNNYAGFHYTKNYLPIPKNLVISILLSLKNVFLLEKDVVNSKKIEDLLSNFIDSSITPQEISEIFNKYRKN